MAASLNESLQVIRPDLAPALVSPAIFDRIAVLARQLPPFHLAGFEVRLDMDNPQVDFQQQVFSHPSEPNELRDHIRRSGWLPAMPWMRIDNLCTHLNTPSSILYENISWIWLEFDYPFSVKNIPVPSVFLSLKKTTSQKVFLKTILGILTLLQNKPAPLELLSSFQHIERFSPEGARIGDIGVFLGRNTDIIRANVVNLLPDQVQLFLKKICLNRSWDILMDFYQRLAGATDRVAVCLDIGAEIYLRIGLEFFIGTEPEKKPRWVELFDRLIDCDLCHPDKAEGLLRWPGYSCPSLDQPPWPGRLMVQSMLGQPDRFSVIGRRLSHVKLDFIPDRPVTAKAYFGFLPLWLQPDFSIQPDEPEAGC